MKPLHPPASARNVDKDLDVIIIPGAGPALSPSQWGLQSRSWIKELVVNLGDDHKTQTWVFEYKVERSQHYLSQLDVKRDDLLSEIATKLGSGERTRPMIFICHSVGGLILMTTLSKAREFTAHGHIIDNTVNIVYLSTPHIVDESDLKYNLIDIIIRSNDTTPGRKQVQDGDNRRIKDICKAYEAALLTIPVVVAYEGIPSKITSKLWHTFKKHSYPTSTIIVGEEILQTQARGQQAFKLDLMHNDTCHLTVGSELYELIRKFCINAITNSREPLSRYHPYAAPAALGADQRRNEIGDVWTINTTPGIVANVASLTLEGTPVDEQDSSQPAQTQLKIQNIHLPLYSYGSVNRNPNFYGRDDVLALIDQTLLPRLDTQTELSVFTLYAMGGMGKTQVAIEFLFTRQQKFDVVLWVYADDETILAQTMARAAIDLGLEEDGPQNISLSCDRVQAWLADPKKHLDRPSGEDNRANWLIIFDNADNIKVLDKYWPKNGVGSVLITSRDPKARNIQRSHDGHDLTPLSTKEASQLMKKLTVENPLSNLNNSLEDVCVLLGGLPLAIAQMAGIMVDLRLSSYEEFIRFYNDAGTKQLYKMQDEDQTLEKLGYNRTLATVWALDNLTAEPLALFQVISLLDPDQIPETILTAGAIDVSLSSYPKEGLSFYKARAQLIKSSLIRVNNKKKRLPVSLGSEDEPRADKEETVITVHRIVQDTTRAGMEGSKFRDTFHAALALVVKVWPFQTLRSRHDLARKETCDTLYPCAIRLKKIFDDLGSSSQFQPADDFAALLNDLGWYLLEKGFVQQSKSYYQLAQKICENSPNRYDDNVALTLRMAHNNMTSAAAETNERKDCLDHALIWMEMSRQLKNEAGDPLVDYELAIVFNETGVAYGMNEKWDQAADFFIRSIKVMKGLENYEPTMLGWPQPNLGLIYWVQGKYNEAEIVLNEILEIHLLAFGRDDTQTFKPGKILHALGNLYWSKGSFDESLDFHIRAFKQYMVTQGSHHHRTADVRHRLAMHFMRLNKLKEAEKMIEEALEVFRSGKYYKPEEARSSWKKAQILRLMGDETKADELAKKAVQLREVLVPKCSKTLAELSDQDFDSLTIFWSR